MSEEINFHVLLMFALVMFLDEIGSLMRLRVCTLAYSKKTVRD